MKRVLTNSVLMLALLVATSAMAGAGDDADLQLNKAGWGVLHGTPQGFNKQLADTVWVIGGDGGADSSFENGFGGWTHIDETIPEYHWHVSDYLADVTGATPGATNLVAYVGDENIPACFAEGGIPGGYGNGWNDYMEWNGTAPDPLSTTNVVMDYYISHDSEPGYDYVFFQVERATGWEDVVVYDGADTNVAGHVEFSVPSSDYVGVGNDQIHVRWGLESDGGWSDEDCRYPSFGAAQVDDIVMTFNGTTVLTDDFQTSLSPDHVGQWYIDRTIPSVGDFTQLFVSLGDPDPCNTNLTWQVAFVDDGEIVPGTNGTQCITWCYGPDGWIVNNTGGVAGPDYHIDNRLISPVVTWPTGDYDGATIWFNVMRHEELGDGSVWPGVFYYWDVRSTNSGDPADIVHQPWQNRGFVQYGGPDYIDHNEVVSDLLKAGRTHVQMSMGVIEYGYNWGWVGPDGTPFPYFDNARFAAYSFPGPAMSAREIDLANDTFPKRGSIDYTNLGVNWARFDMAQDIDQDSLSWDYGDSIVATVSPVRTGAVMNGMPRMYYAIKTNPVFAGVARPEFAAPDGNGIIQGFIEGQQAFAGGNPVENVYAFDLPDTGHLFPGDVVHYYIWAQDDVSGDIGTTTMPGNIDGFLDFTHPLAYSSSFTVRVLPSIVETSPGVYDQPNILYWNDFANRGGENEWHTALYNNGYIEGDHYDTFYTNGPSSGVGNGLAGHATVPLMEGYTTLLYSSGDLSAMTITIQEDDPNGDTPNDAQLITDWLQLTNKNAFITGDGVASDLAVNHPTLLSLFGANVTGTDVRSFIGNQTAPLVVPASGTNPVFSADLSDGWIAMGGCPVINTFDAITPTGTSQAVAYFTDTSGNPITTHAAAVLRADPAGNNNKVVLLPYDLLFVYSPAGASLPYAPLASRTKLLGDVLVYFNELGGPTPTDVPSAMAFEARNYPNPFNPNTTIEFTVPRAGSVSLKIFNVKGELVRTLLDEARFDTGRQTVVWEGDNDQGGKVASGVYFYEVRTNGETRINKMALVK